MTNSNDVDRAGPDREASQDSHPLCDPDTPIMRLFRQLRAKRDRINSQEGLSDETLNSLTEELTALDDEIMRLPVTCAADFAAKVITDSADGGAISHWETGQIWSEARALTST